MTVVWYPDLSGSQRNAFRTAAEHVSPVDGRIILGDARPPVSAESLEPVFYSRPMGAIVTVEVDAYVLEQIEGAYSAVNGFAYGASTREVGGYCLGDPHRIMAAVAACSQQSHTSARLDHPLTVAGYDRLVGDFHVEPGPHDGPSANDLLTSGWNMLHSGREQWYSLIATYRDRDFGLHLDAYVTRRYGGSGSERTKTEPCQVVMRR